MLNLPVIKTSIIVGNDRKLEIDSNVFVKGYIRAKSLFIDGKDLDDYITDKNIESGLTNNIYTWVVYGTFDNISNSYINISTEINVDEDINENEKHTHIGISYNKLTNTPSINSNDIDLYTWTKLPSGDDVILDISQTFFSFSSVGGATVTPALYSQSVAKFNLIYNKGLLDYNKPNFNANNFDKSVNNNLINYNNKNTTLNVNEFIVYKIDSNNIDIPGNKIYNYDSNYKTITTGIPSNFDNSESASINYYIKYNINNTTKEYVINLSYIKSSSSLAPGVLYRGGFNLNSKYYSSNIRRDVVYYKVENVANYWIASNFSKSGKIGWDIPGTQGSSDWSRFGSEFSSIATGIIISEESYVKNTINIGTNNENPVITIYAGNNENETAYISINQKNILYNNDNSNINWKQEWGFPGIYLGTYAKNYINGSDISNSVAPTLSLVGSNINLSSVDNNGLFIDDENLIKNNNALLWDSENLIVIGKIAHFDTPIDYIESEYYNGGKPPGWLATMDDINKNLSFRTEVESSAGNMLKTGKEESILTAKLYRGISDGDESDVTDIVINRIINNNEILPKFIWYINDVELIDSSFFKCLIEPNNCNEIDKLKASKFLLDFNGNILKYNQIKISNEDINNKAVFDCDITNLTADIYPSK